MSYCSSRLDIRKDFREGGVSGSQQPWNLLFWGSQKMRIPSMSCDVWSQEDRVNGLSLTLCSSGLGVALSSSVPARGTHLGGSPHGPLCLAPGGPWSAGSETLRLPPTLSDIRALVLLGPPAPAGVSLFLPFPQLLLHPQLPPPNPGKSLCWATKAQSQQFERV